MRRFLALECRDVVVVVSAVMFMVQLDASVLAVALPQIARDFGVPLLSLSLAITIYLATLVAFLPVGGWAADRFGPRRVLLVSITAFALFSLLCALSASYWQFILCRALMGVSASLLTPVGRLILLKQSRREELVDAFAITAMPMLVAPTLGPSLGGFIVEHGRWEYIFLLNLPVSALLFLVTRWRIAEVPPIVDRRLDWAGGAMMAGALLALLGGIDQLAQGPADPAPWAMLAAGLLLALLTLRHVRRHPDPIVRLDALAIPAFRTTAIGAGAVIRVPARALLFLLPLMFQSGFGFSPFVAGLMLMALNGGDLLLKPWVGPSFDRHGFRRVMTVSALVGLAALGAVAFAGGGMAGMVAILGLLFVVGAVRSIVFTGSASLTFASLDRATMSSGNVLANVSMQIFNALAVSATTLVLGLSAWAGGHAEPTLFDYRLTLAVLVLVGMVATVRLNAQLPRRLNEIHAID